MLKLKTFISKSKVLQKEQGFTMFEVLVGTLIASAFVTISMQALIIATMARVKAQEKQAASQWIQEEIETVKFLADNSAISLDNSKCLADSYSKGYAQALKDEVVKQIPNDRPFLGFNLRLNRSYIDDNNVPYKILKIKYAVQTVKDGKEKEIVNEIAEDYIELMPNVALLCP